MKALMIPVAAILALVLTPALPVAAAPDAGPVAGGATSAALLALITDDDLFSTMDLVPVLSPAPGGTPTQHYGPYTTSSPDSGTCGNDWATDTFDRHFTVHSSATGVSVVEQFKRGSFVTSGPASPGACEPYSDHGFTVNTGVTGDMHGYFVISNTGAPTSTSPYCDANNPNSTTCDTATFINSHFAVCYPATCPVTTYFFHYSSGDQTLTYHEWKNASADRGGDHGDISNN